MDEVIDLGENAKMVFEEKYEKWFFSSKYNGFYMTPHEAWLTWKQYCVCNRRVIVEKFILFKNN